MGSSTSLMTRRRRDCRTSGSAAGIVVLSIGGRPGGGDGVRLGSQWVGGVGGDTDSGGLLAQQRGDFSVGADVSAVQRAARRAGEGEGQLEQIGVLALGAVSLGEEGELVH